MVTLVEIDVGSAPHFVKRHAKRKGSRLGSEKVKLRLSGVK